MTHIETYLKSNHQRFDLFDPQRPFYQSRESRAREKSIISMVLEMASGNNATLFDHHTEDGDVALTPGQAARGLITSQAFGISGTNPPTGNFTDAPCAKGIIFFACGDNLFETLILNLVRYGGEDPIPNDSDDRPAWEMDDPFTPERTIPKGYLDYLTWQNRRVWLYPEETPDGVMVKRMCWATGLSLDAKDIDPMKQYIADQQEGWEILSFKEDRALWRDSAILFRLSENNRPLKVVRWLAYLAQRGELEAERQYHLMALGMAKGKPKPASLNFFRSESLPLSLLYLTNDKIIDQLCTALTMVEQTAHKISIATFSLARLILKPMTADAETTDEKTDVKMTQSYEKSNDEEAKRVKKLADSWGVERFYWSGLELHFHHLVQDLPSDPQKALKTWREQLRRTARAAFDQAETYAGTDQRSLRAIVQARSQFERGLVHVLSESKQTNSTYGGENQ